MVPSTRSGSLLVTRPAGARRYELRLDGGLLSYADVDDGDDVVVVPHVETLREHRGKGHAARLMAGLVDDLRSRDVRLEPICSFAREYIEERPELHDLLAR